MSRRLFWLWMVFLVVGMASAQDDAVLRVDASQPLGAISPLVYGGNLGQAVISPDLMPQVQKLGINYLRLGGNFSDQNDLSQSTVDLYAFQAKQLGAELGLTVRLLGGTPEAAAAIVRYANIEKGHNIRYWSIGNEPSFFVSVHRAESYTTEDLNREWRAIAEAMLAVDPNIILVGPDISQYMVLNTEPIEYLEGVLGGAPRDSAGRDWMQEFLRANGDLVDIVSIHRYPYPGLAGRGNASATIEGLRMNSREWDVAIPNLRKIIQMSAGRDIPIAITEFNSNSNPTNGGEAGPDTFYNAIWFADVFGRLIRQQVEIIAYWNIRSIGDGFGLIGPNGVRPTYYVYWMFRQLGTELLASESSDADVSIFAAQRDDGALTLIAVNLGPDERVMPLELTGFTPSADAEVWRFDAEHNAEMIAPVAVADGTPLTLPGQSVTLYILPAE